MGRLGVPGRGQWSEGAEANSIEIDTEAHGAAYAAYYLSWSRRRFKALPKKLEEPVRFRALIVTAAATAVCVAACSKPQTPAADRATPKGRDLRLGSSLASDSAVVSDVEAGRTPKPRLNAPVEQYRAPQTVKLSKTSRALAEVALARPKLAMPAMAPKMSETATTLAMAPTAESARPTLVVGGGLNSGDADGSYPGFGNHRGVVIIRGGPGGIDDDCDIRHPRSHGGIAVNSSAPALGGGRVTANPRYPH